MPRYLTYGEAVSTEPTPPDDVLWVAHRIGELPAFRDGFAVLCGSVAWGRPTSRSDIDVAVFRTPGTSGLDDGIAAVLRSYTEQVQGRHPVPQVDVIEIGALSERLVTRENLVTGSMPITSLRTEREVFAATGLRFHDHIGALAAAKGEPWQAFHTAYLAGVPRDKKTRTRQIRDYATSFATQWRGQPLRSMRYGEPDAGQLKLMGFAQNFPVHLMRQILAHRAAYPAPDRAEDVLAAFGRLRGHRFDGVRAALQPFLQLDAGYAALTGRCRERPPQLAREDYYRELLALFGGLPFDAVEEAVWAYLGDGKPRRGGGLS